MNRVEFAMVESQIDRGVVEVFRMLGGLSDDVEREFLNTMTQYLGNVDDETLVRDAYHDACFAATQC